VDSNEKLSPLTLILHWSLAFIIIGLLAMGVYMTLWEAWAYYPVHKSLGMLAFGIIIVRVGWRIRNGWPSPVGNRAATQQSLATTVHWILLISMVLQPIFGILNSGTNGYGLSFFGMELVARNIDPINPDEVLPYSESWALFAHRAHQINGYLLITAIVLHVAGALKHHFIDRDATLMRMLGKRVR